MAQGIGNFIDRIQIGTDDAHQIAIGSSAYAVCTTAANTAAKEVNIPGFALNTGTTIHIKFNNANSAASPTLNVSGTGAKAIMQYGTTNTGTAEETSGWRAGAIVTLTYDGTNWVRDQGYNTNSWRGIQNNLTSDSTTDSLSAAQGKELKRQIDLKTSNTGTVTKISTGAGLTGGDITTSGTIKANLTSETKLTNAAADGTETSGQVYPVRLDKNGKLAVNVPWTNVNSNYLTGVGYDSTNKKIYYTKNGSNTDVVTFGSNAFNSTSYLPLSGGTMNGTARIVWADSGSWGSSGATFPNKRGGLYWSGTSDWIDLFAEETASDKLNLVINFGDDTNPSLVLRDRGTDTITLTTSSGNITATTFTGSGASLTSLNASNISSGTLAIARIADSSITNAKLANSKVTIAGNDVNLGGSLAAATLTESLGLSKAMRFIGVATVAITDGSTTDPVISGYSTKTAGDVIIDKDSSREYVWSTTGKWELLGGDSSYKVTQSTVDSGAAATNKWIARIQQNANGVITTTMGTLDTSGTWSGNAATATKLAHTTLDSTTINNTAGSFAFSGSGAPWDGTDWVGLQIGDNVDKFQISARSNTLQFRQNDSGGTNTSWSSWVTMLTSSNYNDYAPTKTGDGASGTWGISITGSAASCTGNAATATEFSSNATVTLTGDTTGTSAGSKKSWSVATTTSALTIKGGRISTPTTAHAAADYSKLYLLISSGTMGDNRPKFSAANGTPAVADGYILDFHWDNSGDYRQQLALLNTITPGLSIRGKNNSTWSDWYPVITTANIGTGNTNGTIKLGGTEVAVKGLGSAAYKNASGTWDISISGNAATATSATRLTSQGRNNDLLKPSAEGGTSSATYVPNTGLTVYEYYAAQATGAPTNYGNYITIKGGTAPGATQIAFPWGGSATNYAPYIRTHSDWSTEHTWSGWNQLAFTTSNVASATALSAEIANDKLPARLRVNTSPTNANPDTFKQSGFYYAGTSGITDVGDANILSINHTNGGWGHQLAFKFNGVGVSGTAYDGKDIYTRLFNSSSNTWTAWYVLLSSGNYTAYTVKKDGTGASGTWGISITGNAATATAIQTAGTTAQFYRGDNSWSDTISGGLFKITNNSNTVTIGSQNASFTHIYNSATIPFIFNNSILTTSGNLGSSSYPFNNLYIGAKGAKGIYYVGTNSTNQMITFVDNTSDANGMGIKIGGGGVVVVGSGEASSLSVSGGDENLYLISDSNAYLEANAQTLSNRVGLKIDTNGHIIPVKAESANNNKQNLGASGNRWAKVYVGSADSYGDTYTPIYWNDGVPTAVTLIQYCEFTIGSGKTGVKLAHTAFTAASYVTQIVVTDGESNLNSAIAWESAAGYINLTCSAVTSGAVSGYILVSRGGAITATATDIT